MQLQIKINDFKQLGVDRSQAECNPIAIPVSENDPLPTTFKKTQQIWGHCDLCIDLPNCCVKIVNCKI